MANHIEVRCANQTNYTTLVQERGTSGVLSGIGMSGARDDHYFQVSVDNTIIHDGYNPSSPQRNPRTGSTLTNYFSSSNGNQHGNNGLVLGFPFDNQFTVKIRDRAHTYTTPRFWVAYRVNEEIDPEEAEEDEEMNGEEQSSSDDSQRDITSITNQNIIEENNIVFLRQEFASGRSREALMGNTAYAIVETDYDQYYHGDTIEARVRFQDYQGEPLDLDEIQERSTVEYSEGSLRLRAFGRHRTIQRKTLDESTEENDRLILEMDLSEEYTGEFEITTDFQNIGNLPSDFTVL